MTDRSDEHERGGTRRGSSSPHRPAAAAAAVKDPSSMLSLRAALADATAAAAAAASERRRGGNGGDDGDSRRRTGTGGRRGRSIAEDRGDDRDGGKRLRSDRGGGGKERGGDSEKGERRREKRRWREVKTSLERKARLYDDMRERGAAGGGGVPDDDDGRGAGTAVDDDDVLVDFARKGGEGGPCSFELDRRGGEPCGDDDHEFTSEGGRDRTNLVPMEDEFGRLVHVPADSFEYRRYLADEARRVRREEMWGAASAAASRPSDDGSERAQRPAEHGPYDGRRPCGVTQHALPVDGTVAPSRDSSDAVASSGLPPSTDSAEGEQRAGSDTITSYSEAPMCSRGGPSTVKGIRDRTKRKKEARLELIRQKQERLRRR